MFQCLREAREAVEVGLGEIDQAHGLACGRDVQRADVEVGHLPGREQREAAAAGHHAGEVVGQVEVRGDAVAVAEPDADDRVAFAERQVVGGTKAGQVGVHRRRAHVDAGRLRVVGHLQQCVQHHGQRRLLAAEVHAGERLVVEEAALRLGRRQQHADGLAAPGAVEIGHRVGGGAAGGLGDRPMGDQAALHPGLRVAQPRIGHRVRRRAREFSDRGHGQTVWTFRPRARGACCSGR